MSTPNYLVSHQAFIVSFYNYFLNARNIKCILNTYTTDHEIAKLVQHKY